ncbi:ARF guanine-nucleotide exchange factor GNOM [Cryptomeria japonica]|uniref:ARF guanine-nucleotide exchange factor GNOM n=1 Tax=Cryptomeria japonica TaxID=3369 RepID=UPI0025AC5B94|nr:ARF guanine-nucleotide exchange factor GNOM [Cryptomeria japonica]XP_057840987.1 ARF guanine-nucleotide exchange factor GNOM [Cryptomeria japonica]XP_057840988.1 ARF guanine-nucleotide exchange factor GNOM [Cryptomeria japonica]XP_057840989.1 ARF guanine-nucleotide exchange factor GNOM [Cryptomeria japonica]XP_057840990.1 ARF guanine-nucleotide exchange factor GNOM [Cryptomeria japonica]XP_059077721.1 ARF guanine-nucleotide exchange factor GNOM [Cryptomeria japonica]
MGRPKRKTEIKAIEEEPQECGGTHRRGALACMVNSEVGAVLAVMRRNARWAGRYMAGDDQLEHSLVQALKSLRRQIFSWQQPWHMIDPSVYLKPFLDVIRSDETGGQITGVALSAVYKILTLEVFDLNTIHVDDAMHSIVDAVTSCRFEVTDAASEEVVLMKILQVLLACMKSKASVVLNNQDICTIVNTCFRVVHQAGSKGELLQRVARHTMHELVRAIFSHLPELDHAEATTKTNEGERSSVDSKGHVDELGKECRVDGRQFDNGTVDYDSADMLVSGVLTSHSPFMINSSMEFSDEKTTSNRVSSKELANDVQIMIEPYGVPCMVEIFHFLCSLLNIVETMSIGARSNPLAFDEDVPLFALGLINSAVELGGESIGRHPKLLALIQDELFRNLMQFGLSSSPLILSMVCSIVLNLYHHLRTKLKLQLEAFFSCVIIRLAQSKYGASYQQQEVAMEALVDFCRQPTFMSEMYANLDCDITCGNIFEDLGNLLSKSAFPVNCPLSAMHILALDGLIAVIHSMADRVTAASPLPEPVPVGEIEEYVPFWEINCESFENPDHWVEFVRRKKYVKRRLMIGADHFNRDPKKGLEFLQGTHLLPEKLDPQSVACFFRYTAGLDKNLVGDFLGNHDEFCVKVLHEFAKTFDFQEMNLDTALRLFLETFRLPGESQKIQRVLEAFSERYYEQSSKVLADKDAAFLLSYSLIMLNTDQHNVQVKKKMTEEDFIRNNRHINAGKDLPREYLSELYHSIVKNEIRTSYEQGIGFPEMTPSRWIDLMRKSEKTPPYIVCDSRPFLDHDMFAIISGPTIAAISVVFDHAEDEDVFHACVDGFLAVAKMSACHHLEDVLDDLVVSLCKFTTLLNPSASVEEPVLAFGDDTKARMATVTVFTIANEYGDYIRTGWRNILDCILRLHKLGLLPARVASDAADDPDVANDSIHGKTLSGTPSISHIPVVGTPRRSSGLMGRFSQLLSLDTDEPRSQPTEQQLAAHQRTVQTIQKCHIDSIFTESKFLQAESLLQLARALIWAAGRPQKGSSSPEDEDTAVFCLELLIAITLNNRDRIMLLWQGVYEHIAGIVQSTVMPCALVEKAVFGLLRICQRLLPYKESLADELLRSLQLILKLDARVADSYCELITQGVMRLVKANAGHIKSSMGWRTISSLLSITARHPEASESGFEALSFIMSDGAHLTQANYVFCLDATRAFAESRVGLADRSLRALDLMAESVKCLVRWSKMSSGDRKTVGDSREDTSKSSQEIGEMWLRLAHGFRKVCLEQREEVRNYALLSLQRCLLAAEAISLAPTIWLQCFDQVIFIMLDDLLDIAQGHSPKEYRNMEGTLHHAMKFLSKIFLQFLDQLLTLPNFRKLWLGVLSHMEKYMKSKLRGKGSEKLHELIPELLKNMLQIMKTRGVLVQRSTLGGDSLWELTWLHVKGISPSLQTELFPDHEQEGEMEPRSDEYSSAAETISSEAATVAK